MENRKFFVPVLNSSQLDVVHEKYYYRKGSRIDLVRSVRPLFLTSKDSSDSTFKEALIAVKRNAPGFWDTVRHEYTNRPLFLDDSTQHLYPRHSEKLLINETAILQLLNTIPETSAFIPAIFKIDDSCVATEFVEGQALKFFAEDPILGLDDRINIIRQLTRAVYVLHKIAHVYHNDLVAGNILLTPTKQIKLIDFAYASESQELISQQKRDVHLLNEMFVRIVTHNRSRTVRALTDSEIKGYSAIEEFLKRIPFSDDSFYQSYENLIL